jgi:translation initiation factor IF-1
MFKVKLDNQHEVLAHISGKMRNISSASLPGIVFALKCLPNDLTKARIHFRLK